MYGSQLMISKGLNNNITGSNNNITHMMYAQNHSTKTVQYRGGCHVRKKQKKEGKNGKNEATDVAGGCFLPFSPFFSRFLPFSSVFSRVF